MHRFLSRMRLVWIVVSIICLLGTYSARGDDGSVRISRNPAFAAGTEGWSVRGSVHVHRGAGKSGEPVVTIGPGAGSISQRIAANGANHMMVSVVLHSVPAGLGKVTIRCFDRQGRELMGLYSPSDIQPGKTPGSLEDYFRPHPLTASVEITVSRGSGPGILTVQRAELDAFQDDDPTLKSSQDLSALMQPFWKGPAVLDEAVLLTSYHDGPATGTLMFRPRHILSVTSYDGSVAYREGEDYTVTGRTLVAVAHSRISVVRSEDLHQGELAWNVIGGKQVLVTYEHDDAWTGPVQPYLGDKLPNTEQRLRGRQPLRVVLYGDSISFGVGSSHMQKMPPWQPPWADLFIDQLRKDWQDPGIAFFNASQSGADSNWARRMAGRMVASLDPDLVILAFGQNDFWSISPDQFAGNLSAVMQSVRAKNPKAEFILLATMRFDPAYSSNPEYWKRVTQYEDRLRHLTATGIQVADMTAISGAVFASKEPRDCLNDPLHPDDYLSRWYAQSLVAALVPENLVAGEGAKPGPYTGKKGVGDDDPSAPQAVALTQSHWYYNWTPRPSKGVTGAAFAPMVWGAESIDADLHAALESGGKELLTFNEPDSQTEANLSVAQAIALWPKLEATGLRLGSPATTTSSPWIDQFMTEAKKRKLRVDFLCLHWYGDITAPDPVGALREYLQGYWDRYHLPIWLTEFSGADFSFHLRKTTVADNARFAAAAAAMLEKLPYVERYAWFGTAWTPDSKDYPTSGLYNHQAHELTPVGKAYAGAGGR